MWWSRSLVIAILLASLLSAGAAEPQPWFWTGSGANNNWSTPLNWQGGIPPKPKMTSTWLIFSGSQRVTSIADATAPWGTAPWEINRLDFDPTSSVTYTLTGLPLSFTGADPIIRQFRGYSTVMRNDVINNDVDFATPQLTIFTLLDVITVAGRITGSGRLVFDASTGAAKLTNPANSYAGATLVRSGIVEFAVRGSIGGSGASVEISERAAAAAGYPIDQEFLSRINPVSRGVVAIAAASSNDLDFGLAGLEHASFGAASIGPTTVLQYSGRLFPANSLHRLSSRFSQLELTRRGALAEAAGLLVTGFGGGRAITFTSDNALAGSTTIASFGRLELRDASLSTATANVGPTGMLLLTRGTLSAPTTTVEAGGTLMGCGTIEGNLVNYGQVSIDCAGGLHVTGAVVNHGTFMVHHGEPLVVDHAFENHGRLDLLTSPGTSLPVNLTNYGLIIRPGEVRVVSFQVKPAFAVYVNAFRGRWYQLQRTASLGPESWQNVGPAQYAQSDYEMPMTDPNPGSGPMFYRVQALY